MPYFVLDQISVIQLAWSADINQIHDQNIGYKAYSQVSTKNERLYVCLLA